VSHRIGEEPGGHLVNQHSLSLLDMCSDNSWR